MHFNKNQNIGDVYLFFNSIPSTHSYAMELLSHSFPQHGTVISADFPELKELIANMHETMYNAYGVGLAAPQIGLAIRLFLVDTSPFAIIGKIIIYSCL